MKDEENAVFQFGPGINLSAAVIAGRQLVGINMRGWDLSGASLQNSKFDNADLNSSNLPGQSEQWNASWR